MQNNKLYILWDNSHMWGLLALRCVTAMQVPFQLITAKEISQGVLSGKHSCMLLVPGGSAKLKALSLGENGKKAIKEFIASGNHYLGFCGGAGLALNHKDGLALCPWARASYSNRWQHLISGHIITKLNPHTLCPSNFDAISSKERTYNDLDSNNNFHIDKNIPANNINQNQNNDNFPANNINQNQNNDNFPANNINQNQNNDNFPANNITTINDNSQSNDNFQTGGNLHINDKNIYSNIPLPIWWPSCFQYEKNENVEILATYQIPAKDMWIADILLTSLPPSIFKEWQNIYGINFDPNFLYEQVCVLHGKYAKGSYILSYSHLETPDSPYANYWLAHLFTKLIGLSPVISITPSWKIKDINIAWKNNQTNEALFNTKDNIQKLINLGLTHNLLFKRNDWLWGWRSGIPGMALNNLNAAVHVALSQSPTKKSQLFWLNHRASFKNNMVIFAEATEKYLLDERLATTLSSSLPKAINRNHLNNQRAAIFGDPMNAGGLYQEILDTLEQIIFLQA